MKSVRAITPPRGSLLIIAGLSLFTLSLLIGIVAAPNIGVASDENRQTLVGSQGGGPGLHAAGSVYLIDNNSVAWQTADTSSYFDVTHQSDGTVLAAFMQSDQTDCGPYTSPCARTGFRIIEDTDADANTQQSAVETIHSFPVRTRANSEVHDVEPLGDGRYLFTDMDAERIAIYQNSSIQWQWNASEYYTAPDDPTRTDWLHINDVDVISPGRYLVSVRNANQLVVIEKNNGITEVINADFPGDTEGDPSLLRQQHNPQWIDNETILVADSHNDRIIELRKQSNGDWRVGWELTSAEGIAFRWPRDADRLQNGNTLITDSLNKRIVEVNRTGETVWSYQTSQVPYEADRLPAGERVGAVAYTEADTDLSPSSSERIPIISFLLTIIQTGVQTPYWFSEIHVIVGLVSLGLCGTGTVRFVRWQLQR
jgi:hypothetical protein